MLQEMNSRTKSIEGLELLTMANMATYTSSLRKCIQASADDKSPSSYVILPYDAEQQAEPEGSTYEERMKQVAEAAEKVEELYSCVSSFAEQAKAFAGDPVGFAKENVMEKLINDCVTKCYLYLVCGICWLPQPREKIEEKEVTGHLHRMRHPHPRRPINIIRA